MAAAGGTGAGGTGAGGTGAGGTCAGVAGAGEAAVGGKGPSASSVATLNGAAQDVQNFAVPLRWLPHFVQKLNLSPPIVRSARAAAAAVPRLVRGTASSAATPSVSCTWMPDT